MFGLLGAHDVQRPINFHVQGFTVEKEDGAEGLSLGGGGNTLLDCQVGEESGDPSTGSGHCFGSAHGFGWRLL